ncbi:MAG: hypothetical protein ACP5MC_00905 [Candidatus Micrarchaeia archaeon]
MEKRYLIIGFMALLAISTSIVLATAPITTKPHHVIVSSQGTVANCQSYPYAQYIATWYCNEINQAAADIWIQWFPIAAAALLVSFMLATIIFVVGVVLRNDKIRTFGIGEFYEAIATTIIVVIFLFLSAVMLGILPAFATGNIDPYTTALTYLGKNINATIELEKSLYNTYLIDSYYSSISLTITAGGLENFVVPPIWAFPIEIYYLMPINAVTSMILEALLLLYTEFYAILFFMYVSIPVFLIPGIILRALFPTRSVGGMMMAIAIGFYFIMPVLFSIAFYFTSTSVLATINTETQEIVSNSQGTGVEQNAISPTSPLVTAVQGIGSTMGTYWIGLLFYPALIIAITYESIMVMADFIGGFAKTSGLLRAI